MLEINSNNYRSEVVDKNTLTIIDCWADWCMPCKMFAPIFDEVASLYSEKATFGKLDVSRNKELVIKLGVKSIPTVLFIRGLNIIDTMRGYQTKGMFIEKLLSILSVD